VIPFNKTVELIMNILQKLTTPRHLWMHLGILIILILFVNLGKWQLSRLEQKRVYNHQISAALEQPPIPLEGHSVTAAALDFRRVQVKGTFMNTATMVIRNQQLDTNSGFSVITPLKLQGSDIAVLINRGWIPRRNMDPTAENLQSYAITDEVIIEGIAHVSQIAANRFAAAAPPWQPDQPFRVGWFRINIEQMQPQIPYPLLPVFIDQTTPPLNQYPQPMSSVDLDEGSHFSYAMQWFSFALILAVTYTFFMWHEVRPE
jgi:surfeit locus 1 family protein